ncbi:hypothetical protein OHB41_27980 [Streptomyces sp. NBC_01571]|uniref:hypothetical protein n=1 Tax=Streptomyces sp. NBC_01571 TaxID=2975883 RepID=UPI00225010AD|nr:hypothetical protein [Streptomyces sp. NBC_01571]MCX4576945.1 hypothetical protein [Streptomyces sp. NBC_01571]
MRQADKNDAKRTVVRSGTAALAVIGLASGCAGGGAAGVRPAPGRRQALPARVAAAWRDAGPDMIRRFRKKVAGGGCAVARLEGHL